MVKITLKGFTLIELLVVIAIIGLISVVVLFATATARNKAADASLQSSLSNFRAQAEHLGTQPNGRMVYVGVCAAGSNIVTSIDADNGSGNYYCYDTTSNWVLATQLNTNSSTYLCTDHRGVFSIYTGTIGATPSGTSCPITP